MKQFLIDKLSSISDEEKRVLAGSGVDRKIYSTAADSFVVSSKLMLRAGNSIAVRTHTRFTPFALHSHNYMEMMYVVSGEITHVIDDRRIALRSGDIILLNKHARHAIERADISDIGINFIVSSDIIESVLRKFGGSKDFSVFLADNLREDGRAAYRVYRIADSLPAENLIESVIYLLTCEGGFSSEVLVESVTLLFHLLSGMDDMLIDCHTDHQSDAEMIDRIYSYIRKDYKNATLSELAKKLSISPTYLSRWIGAHMNVSFKKLLMDQRFSVAEKLLQSTELPVAKIIGMIGYDNSSYFHREFLKRYDCSPLEWRKNNKDI